MAVAVKKKYRCGKCGQLGHNRVGCGKVPSVPAGRGTAPSLPSVKGVGGVWAVVERQGLADVENVSIPVEGLGLDGRGADDEGLVCDELVTWWRLSEGDLPRFVDEVLRAGVQVSVVKQFLGSIPVQVRLWAAEADDTSDETLTVLADDPASLVRLAVANRRYPSAPLRVLVRLARDSDLGVRVAVLGHISAEVRGPVLADALYDGLDDEVQVDKSETYWRMVDVRREVLRSKNLGRGRMRSALGSSDVAVVREVLNNPNISGEDVERAWGSARVREDVLTCTEVLAHPKTPARILGEHSRVVLRTVQAGEGAWCGGMLEALAGNRNCPPGVLERVAAVMVEERGNVPLFAETVAARVVAHPNVGRAVLERFRDDSWSVGGVADWLTVRQLSRLRLGAGV